MTMMKSLQRQLIVMKIIEFIPNCVSNYEVAFKEDGHYLKRNLLFTFKNCFINVASIQFIMKWYEITLKKYKGVN